MLATARRTVVAAAAAAFLLSAAPAAAQELPPETVVARVGDVPVDYATVKRWQLSSLSNRWEGDRTYDDCVLRQPQTDEGRHDCERALAEALRTAFDVVVSAHGYLQKAASVGIAVPPAAGMKQARRITNLFGGDLLTPADRELFARGVWADAKLMRRARAKLPPPTDAQLRRLWKRQSAPPFTTPSHREAAIVALHGRAEWRAAERALRAGRSVAWIGAHYGPPAPSRLRGQRLRFAETDRLLTRNFEASNLLFSPSRRRSFAVAGPGVVLLIQPYGRVEPGRLKPFEQVRGPLVRRFEDDRWAEHDARFDDDLADFTRARTVCRDSFVTSTLCGSHEDAL